MPLSEHSPASLERATDYARSLFRNEVVGLLHLDANWHAVNANDTILRMLEVNAVSDLFNKPSIDFVAPESRGALAGERERRVRGEISTYELTIQGFRGKRSEVICHAIPLFKANEFAGTILTFIEITRLKQTERELLLRNSRYQAVLSAVGEGLVVISRSGELTEFNPLARELMSQTKFTFNSIFPIPSTFKIFNQQGELLSGEQLPAGITLATGLPCRNVLLKMLRPDNSFAWLSVNSEPMFHPEETKPYATVVSFHDVTDLKHSHDLAVDARLREKRILDALPDLLFLVSAAGEVLDYRTGQHPVLFTPNETWIGGKLADLLPASVSSTLLEIVAQALQGRAVQVSLVNDSTEDNSHYYEARASSLDGATVLVIIRDVTELRRAQEQEIRHQRELAHVARLNSLGEMVAGISHEINQPLQAIALYAAALSSQMESDDPTQIEEARRQLQEIRKQSQRAAEIVRRFRMFSSPVARRSTLTAHELMLESVALVETEVKRKKIDLRLHNNLPELFLLVDRVQLQQVFVNLLLNAFDALQENPEGERVLDFSAIVNGNHITFQVRDNGCGLPEVTQERLFASFFTTKPSGVGMGLAISRFIVESHGGKICAGNNPDRGASFYVDLPILTDGGEDGAAPT